MHWLDAFPGLSILSTWEGRRSPSCTLLLLHVVLVLLSPSCPGRQCLSPETLPFTIPSGPGSWPSISFATFSSPHTEQGHHGQLQLYWANKKSRHPGGQDLTYTLGKECSIEKTLALFNVTIRAEMTKPTPLSLESPQTLYLGSDLPLLQLGWFLKLTQCFRRQLHSSQQCCFHHISPASLAGIRNSFYFQQATPRYVLLCLQCHPRHALVNFHQPVASVRWEMRTGGLSLSWAPGDKVELNYWWGIHLFPCKGSKYMAVAQDSWCKERGDSFPALQLVVSSLCPMKTIISGIQDPKT